jgi:outer membrane protein TolC
MSKVNRINRHGVAGVMAMIAATVAAGCTVGPNYKRSAVTMPDQFRSQEPATAVAPEVSLADQRWSTVFDDQTLQQLITTALAANYDLQIAASRIVQAQAQLGINRADQFPTVNGQGIGQGSHGQIGYRGSSISGASTGAPPRRRGRRSRPANGAAARSSPAWSARSPPDTSSCDRSIRSWTSPAAR